jgi:tRNA(Ile)-lysidine synthase
LSDRLGIAVSGGPDSLALLLLAVRAFPGQVEAATIDHQLRVESGEEAAFVAQFCAALDVPHAVHKVTVPAGNMQAEARAARYRALGAWAKARGLGALATAHHADDQAETVLMRLSRASGLSGLAGVRPRTALAGVSLPILRPLLGWRKAQLETICADARVKPVRDPSNENADFDRVRVRQALAGAQWLDSEKIAASARHLAEADQFIEACAQQELASERLERTKDAVRYAPSEHRIIALAAVRAILSELSEKDQRGAQVARLVDRLEAAQNASLGGVLARAETQPDGKSQWVFSKEPPRGGR